jgi:inhibitor of KinA sporulation pathway (predicted exonuclease)
MQSALKNPTSSSTYATDQNIITNSCIYQNIINYVRAQRLSWYGHIYRKPEISIVKKIYKWQPYITRPVGRPKHRWADDVRNDLRKMKLLKWMEQTQDRHEWKKIVEKAKTLHEL